MKIPKLWCRFGFKPPLRGCPIELGGNDSAAGDPTLAESTEVVAAALEAETNWLDTAESYHNTRNESLIGEVLDTRVRRTISITPRRGTRPPPRAPP